MDIAQMEIQARCDRDEIRRLRKENARLTGELAEIRCELRKHDARDIPITSIEMIRNLTRERDEARAELRRFEELIIDWFDDCCSRPITRGLVAEARRIRAQREPAKAHEPDCPCVMCDPMQVREEQQLRAQREEGKP